MRTVVFEDVTTDTRRQPRGDETQLLIPLVVLDIAIVAIGVMITFTNGGVIRAIHRLGQVYRRYKSLEMEYLQAAAMARRQTEIKQLLDQADGWQVVLNQLLADALPGTGARIGPEGILGLSVTPAPSLVIAGEGGQVYEFTTSPPERGLFGRRETVIPLDASLYPTARAEVQAVWDRLIEDHPQQEECPALPRQADWFLVVHRHPPGTTRATRRAPGLRIRRRHPK